MDFKNPANGHVESNSFSWLWALLFGGLYFIAAGLWAPFLVWLVMAIALFAALGGTAIVIMFFVNLVFAAMAPSMVRAKYLREGWIEAAEAPADGGVVVQMDGAPPAPVPERSATPRMRAGPFCAEDIRAEAIKCKHCGSAVLALPPA